MKIVVLGGLGLQGKAALADLAGSEGVTEIVCADANLDAFQDLPSAIDRGKIVPIKIDATDQPSLFSLLEQDVDAVIDLLPLPLMRNAFEAALKAGVPLVSTNYSHRVRDLDDQARSLGIALMTECGLDPGIDLVIISHAVQRFDEIHVIKSYCGGIPEKAACNNPLNYKISWNWEGVLNATRRDSRMIIGGQPIDIPAEQQHETRFIRSIDFPGLGLLEAIPNGDAVYFTDQLGVTNNIQETGRYSLRWPGWSAFWQPLKQMGFLSDEPVPGLPATVTPRQLLSNLLAPQLQYQNNEKDLTPMINIFEGIADGRRIRRTSRLLIEQDSTTGLMAMGKGVGYPASIVAQMIADGEIQTSGVLTPVRHVPPPTLFSVSGGAGYRS